MSRTEKRRRGDFGERAACRYLFFRGYRILARGFEANGCEIDIVAKSRKVLAFVEVKTRRLLPESETCLTKPAAAVDREKQRHIISAARAYLGAFPEKGRQIRFDVIEVYLDPKSEKDKAVRIHHIPSAFTL